MQEEYLQVQKRRNIVTIILIVINIMIWVIMELLGDTLDGEYIYKCGGMYPPAVLNQGEWYRLFSSMFIHFGAEHLANNMVILGAVGGKLEEAVGKWRFLAIYLGAGLCGNLLSLYDMSKTKDYAVGAGASGAIFGLIGAMVWLAIRNKGQFEGLTTRGLLFMVALCLYYGFTATGVDNWAHIGGGIGGFILGILLYQTA